MASSSSAATGEEEAHPRSEGRVSFFVADGSLSEAEALRVAAAAAASLEGAEGAGEELATAFRRQRSRRHSLGARGVNREEEEVQIPVRPGLSEHQVQSLREIFALFDSDGEHVLIPSEVRSAASQAELDRQNPEVWKLLSGLTGNEPVNFQEFVALITEPLGDHFTKSGVSRLLGLCGHEAVMADSVGLADLRSLVDDLGFDIEDKELRSLLEKAGAGPEGRLSLDSFYEVMKIPD